MDGVLLLLIITKVPAVRMAASAQSSSATKPLREQVSQARVVCGDACLDVGCMLLRCGKHARCSNTFAC